MAGQVDLFKPESLTILLCISRDSESLTSD